MLGSPRTGLVQLVCQAVIRWRHDCIRTSVRVGGRFGGRVEASARPRVTLARTGSLVRKLDRSLGLVIHRGRGGV